MKCEDAAEFVSALHDGERIPREAAEHLGECETCQGRLETYSRMSAEMRRMASLDEATELSAGQWSSKERMRRSWWSKGRQPVQIPRLAFALMLAVIFLLSGGLVLVRARPNLGGPVLLLTYKIPQTGKSVRLAITTDANPETNHRSYNTGNSSGVLYFSVRFVSKVGERVELSVKSAYKKPVGDAKEHDVKDLPEATEETIWISPGENKEILVAGFGPIELSGEFMDHVPALLLSPEETLDPKTNELRIVSPVLVRGKEVVFNGAGSWSIGSGDDDLAVMIYLPSDGRYLISTAPFTGAVEASVGLGQIKFNLQGRDYLLLTAMPTTRSEHVWVTHEPRYRLSQHMKGEPDDREMFLVRSLKTLLAEQMTHYSK